MMLLLFFEVSSYCFDTKVTIDCKNKAFLLRQGNTNPYFAEMPIGKQCLNLF